jgi:addiction module HigA family antidote
MIEINREPTHAGEILKEEFLAPLDISQSKLAKDLHTSFRAINELINQKRGITTEMALKLSKYFGTTPELWLNIQNQYNIYKTLRSKKADIEQIQKCNIVVA